MTDLEKYKARLAEFKKARDLNGELEWMTDAKWTQLIEDLKAAVEALEFYGNKENWNSTSCDVRDITVILDDEDRTTNKFYYGGKRARQTIEKITKRGADE